MGPHIMNLTIQSPGIDIAGRICIEVRTRRGAIMVYAADFGVQLGQIDGHTAMDDRVA